MSPKKKQVVEEVKEFPQRFLLLAADFSLRRPGFCLISVDRNEEVPVKLLKVWHLDFKKSKETKGDILVHIAFALENVMDMCIENNIPLYLAREKAFNSRGSMYEISIFEVVGVSDYVAAANGFKPWDEMYPVSVKKTITGSGKATKEEVAAALEQYFPGVTYEVDDESDAAAVAISWLIQNNIVKQILKQEPVQEA